MASQPTTIGAAVAAVIAGVPGAPSSIVLRKVVRKMPSDPVPILIISFGDNSTVGESFGNGSSDFGTVIREYEMSLIYLYHTDAVITADGSTANPTFMEDVRQALDLPTLAGAPSVTGTRVGPLEEFADKDWDTGYDVSAFSMVFTTCEARNS